MDHGEREGEAHVAPPGPGRSLGCRCVTHALAHLQVDSEEPVFEAVVSWVKHARTEREESLPDLLQYVRMPLLSPRYITDVIDTEVSGGAGPPPAVSAHCESPRLWHEAWALPPECQRLVLRGLGQ